MKDAHVLQIRPLDFSQFRPEEVLSAIQYWAGWLGSGNIDHLRIISRAVPLDMGDPIARARESEARAGDEGSTQVIRQYRGLLERTAQGELYANEHYMVLWMGQMEAMAVAQGLSSMGLYARLRPGLPPMIAGRYNDAWNQLEPQGNQGPFLRVLTSYQFLGTWDWSVLARLLYRGFPVTVSLDIESMSQNAARKNLNMAKNAIQASIDDLGQDVNLTERWHALQQGIQAIQQGSQTLHLVVASILVPGRTVKELNERVSSVETLMGPYMALRDYRPQAQMFRSLFTTDERGPAAGVISKRLRHNVLSAGTAVAMGVLGARRRGDTDGVLWGFADNGAPVFWDGFGEDLNEPNHGVILGMTGSGKTFSTHMLLLREALLRGTQVIELEPMGHGRLLAEAVGKDRSSYNALDFASMTVNPLEIVYDTPQDQHAHVMTQIGLLLDRPLNNFEEALIEMACRDIYAGLAPDSPSSVHPRLENLVMALRREGDDAKHLAKEIAGIYVDGTLGKVFNAPTNLDFALSKDVVVFDFNRIPDRFKTLLYGLVLTALQRECLRRRRDRRRLIFVDEFKRMSEEPLLARTVAMMFKTFRTAGAGVWVAEQNLFTLTGQGLSGGGLGNSNLDVASGLYVLENARFYVFLAQQPAGIEAIQARFPDVTNEHLQVLRSALVTQERGHGVVKLPDGNFTINFVPTQAEKALLGGS